MTTRNALTAALAFGLALSAPLAFAQDAATDAQPQQSTDAQATDAQTPPADAAAATDGAMAAQPAAPTPQTGAEPKQITWSDLDADKNGKLTKAEAAPVQALSSVFDDADTDKDGALTPDEYKAYVAKNQGAAAAGSEG